MQSTTPGAATRNLTWVMSSASLRIRQVGIRDEDAESEQGFLAFQLSYWSKSSPKTHQASGVLAKFNAEGKEGPFLDLCVYLEWDWEEKYSLGQQVHKAFIRYHMFHPWPLSNTKVLMSFPCDMGLWREHTSCGSTTGCTAGVDSRDLLFTTMWQSRNATITYGIHLTKPNQQNRTEGRPSQTYAHK